ncbi:metal ABC transporter solute-binding protein, Zn/Mn family [Halomonas saccharevitans]|uniref:Zinc/manganese transport system substrate-binding protein n=1 Tax=Halomonas saccharevitans TaxID=416872 RepID=A0A1I6XEZ8_9GAMM|nr:zinc ABC transporter substrate-binding protein [Halomonas saccharevitans]SFT36948.1 zinc/manganese transport system substrate-binding protein [Halomonas saccharevitans]
MRLSRSLALLAGMSTLLALPAALAAERVQVVTSFSVLADMIDQVGGEHVEVTSLVGPDSDAHVYSPRPTDARRLAEADLVVFNGLQFEGWMERLIDASDFAGPLVVATDGLEAHLGAAEDDGHDDEHGEHADHDHGHEHGGTDPHAWQDLGLGEVYVDNIRDGLIAADPAHGDAYRANAERYLDAIAAADDELRALLDEIPDETAVITGHASFGHFARAYGLRFLSPQGLSTAGEPSAANMARLIDVIREQNVRALFHENMTSPAMIDQLAEETDLPVAGTLYADALANDGEASSWLGMMRHNARVLHDALAEPGRNHKEPGHKEPGHEAPGHEGNGDAHGHTDEEAAAHDHAH